MMVDSLLFFFFSVYLIQKVELYIYLYYKGVKETFEFKNGTD